MKKLFKVALIAVFCIGVIAASAYFIITSNIVVLDAKGMIGKKEADLIITASLLMLIVVIPVYILTLFFAWKYREGGRNARHEPDWEHNYIAEYCWWGVPLIIVAVLAVITWKSSHELSPFKPIESDKKTMKIQVVALQWKWLFIYPEQGIASVNLVQFPEKTPINFEITSDAPMNSFWIPQLGGQIYAMPAMRSQLYLIADEPGSYRGLSSNISGSGFAGMTFTAVASSEADFQKWVADARRSGKTLKFADYLKLVKPSENVPVSTYVLGEKDLFDQIMQQYEPPQK
ncbi:MAG: ubiquinol oxidase subunit II [Verrucomicrobia bacterium]|nr:ubiquinol oxidase subunit II [Verrucomicrobiota bacterium]